ncbi:uncharacterized protein LOC131161310 [Malania oleifera]|uniref:uncharacterized protein LOC131161310 n=1 Tax=Malania oleifera TaxID=397392 RepID=UPI0025ADFA79|nr:uncharacterized protein LOC131161310 [Malania oleifera]
MEQCSYSSSSSSTYQLLQKTQEDTMKTNTTSSLSAVLHSVRKPLAKHWKKPAIAPPPPVPARVYKVEPKNFKDVVQKLTGAPKFQPQRRLQRTPPPPLDLIPTPPCPNNIIDTRVPPPQPLLSQPTPLISPVYRDLMSETLETKPWRHYSSEAGGCLMSGNGSGSPLGFGSLNSPSSYAWCFPLLSPGTLSILEQGTV